ncbi:MAG: YbaK/EbsC family protein [Acidimicrobiales bacterium]
MEDPVIDQLEALGVEHEVLPCDPELADTAAFCEAYGHAAEDSANAILVIGKPRSTDGDGAPPMACCLVLASTRLDVNGVVRRRLGVRKASFASADDTESITGMQIGGVTPFGLPPGLPVWIDSGVMDRPSVIVGGGTRDRKIRCTPSALMAIPGAEVVDMAKAATGGG